MKLLKLHFILLILFGLPGFLTPLFLLIPSHLIPDILGILSLLALFLWLIHVFVTSLIIGIMYLLRLGLTSKFVVTFHSIVFILLLIYAISLYI